jgi:hypothetical protein
MSSQQFPPMSEPNASFGAPPVVYQPSVPFASEGAPGGRRTGLIAAGAFILIAGVAAGIVMVAASDKNYDESVQNLARAPVGCVTSLRFDQSGTFTVYVETVGSIGEVRGDCSNTDADYEFAGNDLPDVDVVLQNEAGDTIDLTPDSGNEYDAGGAVGQSIATVQIDQPGDYDITVTSADSDFAIAIGKNPKDSADTLKGLGALAFLAGVVVGGIMLVLGLRRRKTPPPAVAQPFASGESPQTFDPGFAPVAPPPTVGWPPVAPPPPPVAPAQSPWAPAPQRIAPPTWQPLPPTVRPEPTDTPAPTEPHEPTQPHEPTEPVERPNDPPANPPAWPAPPPR